MAKSVQSLRLDAGWACREPEPAALYATCGGFAGIRCSYPPKFSEPTASSADTDEASIVAARFLHFVLRSSYSAFYMAPHILAASYIVATTV